MFEASLRSTATKGAPMCVNMQWHCVACNCMWWWRPHAVNPTPGPGWYDVAEEHNACPAIIGTRSGRFVADKIGTPSSSGATPADSDRRRSRRSSAVQSTSRSGSRHRDELLLMRVEDAESRRVEDVCKLAAMHDGVSAQLRLCTQQLEAAQHRAGEAHRAHGVSPWLSLTALRARSADTQLQQRTRCSARALALAQRNHETEMAALRLEHLSEVEAVRARCTSEETRAAEQQGTERSAAAVEAAAAAWHVAAAERERQAVGAVEARMAAATAQFEAQLAEARRDVIVSFKLHDAAKAEWTRRCGAADETVLQLRQQLANVQSASAAALKRKDLDAEALFDAVEDFKQLYESAVGAHTEEVGRLRRAEQERAAAVRDALCAVTWLAQ
jgi:hypothetical protein